MCSWMKVLGLFSPRAPLCMDCLCCFTSHAPFCSCDNYHSKTYTHTACNTPLCFSTWMVVFLTRTGSVSSVTSPGYDGEHFVSKYVFHIDFVAWQDIYCRYKPFPNDADKVTVWAALCLWTDGIVVVRGQRCLHVITVNASSSDQ